MTIKTKFAALGTAFVIGLTALSPTTGAQAAPLAPAAVAQVGTATAEAGVVEVGHRRKHRRGVRVYFDHGYGYHHRRRCRIKRVKVWDPYYGEYFYEKRKICRRRKW
ncbi:MAG: hypothetical protein AAGD34_19530 [Pseudomonadota bacterium]